MKKLFHLLSALSFAALFSLPLSAFADQASGQPRAVWIGTERAQSVPNSWLVYRKTFSADSVPQQLMARIAADSKYWLWINGELAVFEGSLKRGPEPGASYVDVVEIAPFLKKGDNTLAVLVWHFGKNGFSHVSSGSAGLFFEALSPALSVVSDPSWLCGLYEAYSDTEAPHPNFRLPESNIRFDARRELPGWQLPAFDGRLAKAIYLADPGNAPFGKLVDRPIPLWKDHGLTPYINMERAPGSDTVRCRLPYNCQATPWLRVDAPAGKTISIVTDNYMGGSEPNVRAEYITRQGVQEYESLGWMNGHEILYIVPDSVEILDLRFRETGYDTDFSGSFSCSDPFLDELWKRSARTLYVTMRDNYMDCPDRERAQWWGDEVNELGETFYALSPSAWKLARKGILELVRWQRADGVIASPVPAANWNRELPLQMLASVGWYGFHTQYFFSGDSSFVAEVYHPVRRYLHEVWQLDGDGLPVPRAGDWSWGDWGQNVDLEVLTACWYYLALKAELSFARMLGEEADAAAIQSMMDAIEAAFDSRYWTPDGYRSPSYTGLTDDRAQAMAVVSGLASPDKYPAIASILQQQMHASPYMEKYVLEALFVMDRPQQALDRMRLRYAPMLAYTDYTTLFEGWGIGKDGFGGGTVNHAWSGGPLTLLSQKVCGIAPLQPGFAVFAVNPQMGDLSHASASLETDTGIISVSLRRSGRLIDAVIDVPAGKRCVVPAARSGEKSFGPGTHSVKIDPRRVCNL